MDLILTSISNRLKFKFAKIEIRPIPSYILNITGGKYFFGIVL